MALSNFSVGEMKTTLSPKVLVLGHSFVSRLGHDLNTPFSFPNTSTFYRAVRFLQEREKVFLIM